ncbi:MAG TPA: ice-binding family protein [Polyangiaceae bacterium]|nr:ice-binding family protein [Polyangiaceae bacterium]
MTLSRSYRNSAANAFLLISVVAACGSSDAADSTTHDSNAGTIGTTGGSHQGGSGGFAGAVHATAGRGGTPSVGGNNTTGGTHSMSGSSAAGGAITTDAGSVADGGNLTLPVDLGRAGDFVILAKTGISTVPTSAITGDIGVSPAAATYITQFSLIADPSNVFSTSAQITGKVYAATYASPTPSLLTTAVSDMELAYTDAAGRAPNVTELGAGDIGGMTLTPGVYQWSTGLLIPANVTLSGSATSVWIFQIAGDLTLSSATNLSLAGGALAKNVFWEVAGAVSLGTTSHCEGIVLTQTAITLETGASVNGRLLAQTAVNIDSSTVVEPAQ